MTKKNLRFIFVISILLCLIFIPGFVHGFNITTDETTETSIIWNLSENTNNITTIALDGILLEGYIPNAKQLVQNNLYAGETHLIVVQTDDNITSTGEAKTESKATSENEKLAANINLYFLFFVALMCIIVGLFVRYIALAGVAASLLGMIIAFNHSLLMGIVFFAALITSIWLSLTSFQE